MGCAVSVDGLTRSLIENGGRGFLCLTEVGPGKANRPEEVLLIQRLLNASQRTQKQVTENGIFSVETGNALREIRDAALAKLPTVDRCEEILRDVMDFVSVSPTLTFAQAKVRYRPIIEDAGVDFRKNGERAREIGRLSSFDLSEFVHLVSSGGDWDYKVDKRILNGINQRTYTREAADEFGNYHFGHVAHAFGFPLSVSLSGAGLYQTFRQQGGNQGEAILGYGLHTIPEAWLLSRWGANKLTLNGFGWGDNPGDSVNIMNGWLHCEEWMAEGR